MSGAPRQDLTIADRSFRTSCLGIGDKEVDFGRWEHER